MTDTVNDQYTFVQQDVWSVVLHWGLWKQLYFSDSEEETVRKANVRLLRASVFFDCVDRLLFNEVVLGICRLLDPEKQGKNDNLTIF